MTVGHANAPADEVRRALVFHDRPLVVDLITLTLNPGVFVVRAASNLAEAEAILAEWPPHITVVDMDHDDSSARRRASIGRSYRRSGSARSRSISQSRRARRHLGRPPLGHRAEPALPAGEPGRTGVSRDQILDAIWGTDFVAESNIVDRHIRSLRIKLQNDYRHPRFIATVAGLGYRFIPTFSNTGWDGEEHPGPQPRS